MAAVACVVLYFCMHRRVPALNDVAHPYQHLSPSNTSPSWSNSSLATIPTRALAPKTSSVDIQWRESSINGDEEAQHVTYPVQ